MAGVLRSEAGSAVGDERLLKVCVLLQVGSAEGCWLQSNSLRVVVLGKPRALLLRAGGEKGLRWDTERSVRAWCLMALQIRVPAASVVCRFCKIFC